MNEKRMEEWYNKFLGVLEFFKRNPYIHAEISVSAIDSGEPHYRLAVYTWKKTERSVKDVYMVGVYSWSEMDDASKKAWAAIKRLMK